MFKKRIFYLIITSFMLLSVAPIATYATGPIVSNKFDSPAELNDFKITYGTAVDPSTNTTAPSKIEIVADSADSTNNVLRIQNGTDGKQENLYTALVTTSILRKFYPTETTGLLRVKYRFKDVAANNSNYWDNFGEIQSTDSVFRLGRTYNPGCSLTTLGIKSAVSALGSWDSAAKTTTPTISAGQWHSVEMIFDMDNNTFNYYYDNLKINNEALYMAKSITTNNNLIYFRGRRNALNSISDLYIDDLLVEKVSDKLTTNLTTTIPEIVNPDEPLILNFNFNDALVDKEVLHRALTVTDSNNTDLSSSNIGVELSSDKMSATITLNGLAASTNYTFKINNNFAGNNYECMATPFITSFTTGESQLAETIIPIVSNRFDSPAELNDFKITYGTAVDPSTNTTAPSKVEIVADPADSTNNVLRIQNGTDGKTENLYTTLVTTSVLRRFYPTETTGLLRVKYRFKDVTANNYNYWNNFGEIQSTDSVFRLGRTYNPGFSLTTLGIRSAVSALGSLDSEAKTTTPTISAGQWHSVEMIFDMDHNTFNYYYDNLKINNEALYMAKPITTNNNLIYFLGRRNAINSVSDLYIDDLIVEKALGKLTASLTSDSIGFNASKPLIVDFNSAIDNASVLKNAITINKTNTSTYIDPSRISVSLSENKKRAIITIDGGLEYGCINYKLTISNNFMSATRDCMEQAYVAEFTTALAEGVCYVSHTGGYDAQTNSASVTIKVSNPTSVPSTAWVVLAAYTDQNEMVGISQADLKDLTANGTGEVSLSMPNITKTPAKVLVFLWDSIDRLTPYHMPISIYQVN